MSLKVKKIVTGFMLVTASIGILGCADEAATKSDASSSEQEAIGSTLGLRQQCKNVSAPGGGSTVWQHDLGLSPDKNIITLVSSSHSDNLSPTDSSNQFQISTSEIMASPFGCVVREYSSGTIVSTGLPFSVQIAVCINASQEVEVRHIAHINGVAQPISGVHCTLPF